MGISVSEEPALSIMSLHSTFSADPKEGGIRLFCNSGIYHTTQHHIPEDCYHYVQK